MRVTRRGSQARMVNVPLFTLKPWMAAVLPVALAAYRYS